MAKKQEDNQQLKELAEKVQVLEDQLKRAVADYHNLEKRIQEGRSELTNWATTELISKLLPVLDHLEKAFDGVNGSDENVVGQNGWVKGVELAVKEFKNVLQSEGLEEIVAEGEFNPVLQEAVDTKEGENGKILEVVQKGYTLNGKIIRPVKVVVGKRHSGEPQSGSIESDKDAIASLQHDEEDK